MSDDVEILNRDIGDKLGTGYVVLRGTCPFCNHKATFRQIACKSPSKINGFMLPLLCEGCSSVIVFSFNDKKMYPSPMLKGVEGLPKGIEEYYQEALRCISVDSPNGAVTLFRKIIHAIGIYYGIAEKNDNKNLFKIIEKLADDGYILPRIKNALLRIKDIGNDGAHINGNEPDISQALILKNLIDLTLNSTILCDQNLKIIEEAHKCNKSDSNRESA
ncbi:MAG: DUF4145 domain-containing protein [Methanosarcinaceae archaeon]